MQKRVENDVVRSVSRVEEVGVIDRERQEDRMRKD